MNKFYEKAMTTAHDRRPVFEFVINNILTKFESPSILEIGASRSTCPDDIFGDGFSSLYWADYLLKLGRGKLVIVDIDSKAIENCKTVLSDFIGKIGIEFICADGLKYLKENNKFDFIYLDSADESWITYECYRLINRTKSFILCDDANGWEEGWGKCVELRRNYKDYQLFKVNSIHEMIFYPKVEGNEKSFKIGSLELDYIRDSTNRAWLNERACELALGKWFLNKYNHDVNEIGAVLNYYGEEKHRSFDPYDHHPLCEKIDVFNLNLTGGNTLSLSTVEHILNDSGYNSNQDLNASFRAVTKIAAESKNYLITFPIGSHPVLQKQIFESDLSYKIMRRKNKRGPVNNWEEVQNTEENMFEIYGHFEYQLDLYGNAINICIITNDKEILN